MNIDQLSKVLLEDFNEENSLKLFQKLINEQSFNLANEFGSFLISKFPYNYVIKTLYAYINYTMGNHAIAYNTFTDILNLRGLNKEQAEINTFNAHFSIDHISDNYIYYNKEKISNIIINSKVKKEFPMVTFSITSCKRFDLFEKTINSFINCCNDIHLIDKWICVDDNSNEEDRNKMKELYPFFTFYFKNKDEKGHPKSMNIIRNIVLNDNIPFLFHIEDDWKFFCKRNYISDCLDILSNNSKLSQCLINKNYAEREKDVSIVGGIFNTTYSGLRYYIHEYINTDEQKKEWINKYGEGKSTCNYWPGFSFRPSLLKTKVLKDIGMFNENISHFEMDYSFRCHNAGYLSAFLESIYCLHIGRLTSERFDNSKKNAYILNDEIQFGDKNKKEEEEEIKENKEIKNEQIIENKEIEEIINSDNIPKFENKNEQIIEKIINPDIITPQFYLKTFVINLERRPDRFEKFERNSEQINFLKYNKFFAIDGMKLKPTEQLQRIFENNDYNMRKGMVGCALSHIKLYIDLINDENASVYLILEDDIDFVPEFQIKFMNVIQQLQIFKNWDLAYLGHHIYPHLVTDETYNKIIPPKIEKWNSELSLQNSKGGTGGYLITKNGAKKLLDFINKNGMTNGIDTVQQKSADTLKVFYCIPHLIYSECYVGGDNNTKADTDIQTDYSSLTLSIESRLEEEKKYYKDEITQLNSIEDVLEIINKDNIDMNYYYLVKDTKDLIEIQKIDNKCKNIYYILDNKLIIITKEKEYRYLQRLKNYNIEDALIFN
jgi:GR25 family glycosyltransferase involved in LPS biosynthesis